MKVLIVQSGVSKHGREKEVRDELINQLHDGSGIVMIPLGFNLIDIVEDPVDICFTSETPKDSNGSSKYNIENGGADAMTEQLYNNLYIRHQNTLQSNDLS